VKIQTHDVHVFRFRRSIEQLQNPNAFPDSIGANSARPTGSMKIRETLVSDPTDHSFTVNYSVDIGKEAIAI